jgi:hypothetical protein
MNPLINSDGEMLVMPLELPMYDGNNRELSQRASTSLTSSLRHFAVVDAIVENNVVDPTAGETGSFIEAEYSMAANQLVSTIVALVSLAHNYEIDIMQEIYDLPWMV